MQENVGGADRAARSVAGPLLMGLGFSRRDSPFGALMLGAGAVITGTAITSKCPMNALFGIDTAHAYDTRQAPRTELHGEDARPDMERTEGMPRAAEYGEQRGVMTPAPD